MFCNGWLFHHWHVTKKWYGEDFNGYYKYKGMRLQFPRWKWPWSCALKTHYTVEYVYLHCCRCGDKAVREPEFLESVYTEEEDNDPGTSK